MEQCRFYFFLLVTFLFLVGSIYSGSAKGEFGLLIQPWYTFDENGSYADSGDAKIDVHRTKFSLKIRKKVYPKLTVQSKISVDLSESTFKKSFKNAHITLKVSPRLQFKCGKFKIPFGANNLQNASELNTIHRSFTTDHLKKELNISGYACGGILLGTLFDKLSYAGGVFQYRNNVIKGFTLKDIVDFPVASLSYAPKKNIIARYMIAAPQAGSSLVNGVIEAKRFVFHNASFEYSYKDKYAMFFEYFNGIDTSQISKAKATIVDYNENVTHSLYTLHSYSMYLFESYKIKLLFGFEYLNGLNVNHHSYFNRSFYYSLLFGMNLYLKKSLWIQLNYDSQYDHVFKSIHKNRFAAQITYSNNFKLKQKNSNK